MLVDKDYAWGSRKPSKRALEAAFYKGLVTISQRAGMLKTYELLTRHFNWDRLPRAAIETRNAELPARSGPAIAGDRERGLDLLPGRSAKTGDEAPDGVASPAEGAGAGASGRSGRAAALGAVRMTLDAIPDPAREQIHILSPFDPLIIQRKRLRLFFDYEYRFEAYVPKHKRVFGYFVCPVLIGDRIVAALDLKTDRQRQQLLVQRWHWVGRGASRAHRQQVDAALHTFEQFQLGRTSEPQERRRSQ